MYIYIFMCMYIYIYIIFNYIYTHGIYIYISMYLCVCVWQGLSTKPALPPACFSPRSFSNSQQDLELHAKKVHSRLTFQGMNLAQLVSLEVGQRGLDEPMNFKGPDFGKGRTCELHGCSSFFSSKNNFSGVYQTCDTQMNTVKRPSQRPCSGHDASFSGEGWRWWLWCLLCSYRKNLKLFSARSIRKEPFLGDASLGESLTVSDPNPMTSAVCESGGIE